MQGTQAAEFPAVHFKKTIRGYHQVNRHHRLAALAAATTLALSANAAIAAQRVDLQRLDATRVNQQYKAVAARVGVAAKARDKHAEMLGLDADSRLRELRTTVDRDGTKHYRYQQTFRGIPVWGEHLSLIHI